MYALGEIVERISNAEIMGTYLYVNDRSVMQRLSDDEVKLVSDKSVVDTEQNVE